MMSRAWKLDMAWVGFARQKLTDQNFTRTAEDILAPFGRRKYQKISLD